MQEILKCIVKYFRILGIYSDKVPDFTLRRVAEMILLPPPRYEHYSRPPLGVR